MAKNRFTEIFKDADAAFDGAFKDELNGLYGLSREEIDAVTPDTTDLKIYSVLIKVVEQASKDNLKLAQLVENIKNLGDLAIKIAKKVPQLAKFL